MDIVDREGAEAEASAAGKGADRTGAGHESAANGSSADSVSADSVSALAAPASSGSADDGSVSSSPVSSSPISGSPISSRPVVTGSVSATRRDDEIDINTDESPEAPVVASRSAGLPPPPVAVSPAPSVLGPTTEDGTIEVSDDEIEMAEPALSRSLPPASVGMGRSRPPAPPSSRGLGGRPSLPPPSHLVGANGSSRPPGVDPWLLANKTLELSHAQARIAELEDQVAFRDARIVELEDALAKARRKLEDLESRSRPAPAAGASAAVAAAPVRPATTESQPAVAALDVPVSLANGTDASGDDEDDDDDDVSIDDRESAFGADDAGDAGFGRRSAGGGPEDDLQQISGIGPRFEAALRKQGITRLSQIAAWSDADVRQVAKALKIPKSRIVKGRWVEVAREVIGTRAASE
ncbi:MAG TPA: hypothetical protein VMG12_29930 [Polyangiaceae bacterium]|nr:hypothetical protein [Polyangiaceae bacterium]